MTAAAFRPNAPLATFAAGLVTTIAVAALLWTTATERDSEAFHAAARDAENAIVTRVETSVALLRGAAGLFSSAAPAIDAAAFRRYVARLQLREQYPGILGIGYTLRIAPGQRAAVEQRIRAEGAPGFRVWPAEPRTEYHSIIYLEPLDERNRAAIGYDMYTEATRRAAMARARDVGQASASGVVELVQEIDERKQPGFLIYVPVYSGGIVPDSVDARREQLLGFAYSPIRAGDFLSSSFTTPPTAALAVYHGTSPSPQSLLYEVPREGSRPRFEATKTIDVAGQPWTFVFRSRMTFTSSLVLPLAVIAAGIALSLLLAVLVNRESVARWQAQQSLERERTARSEAERASVMKDEFLATISHELRTPLSTIVGWTELLRRGAVPQREIGNAVEVVFRNAKAQAKLIDDLLDMSRIISGKLRLDVQAVNTAAVVHDAVAALRPAAEAKDLRLQLLVDTSDLTVRGDPARLQQVVWNLLANAIKFTPRGGRVQVALERSDSCARLVVSDTGEGIEPEALDRIFGRFQQADASITRRHGGLGIGLALVKQLVDMHGGKVSASSAGKGTGATFVVELPLMIVHAAAEGARSAAAATECDLAGITVLAVEDESDARELMRRVLEDAGASVHCVANADEALAALTRMRPDVVLSDIGMPGVDGYEFMRRVRALPSEQGGNVPAAAITAYARHEDRLEALRAGFQTHVVKPVGPEEFVAVVAALARRSTGRTSTWQGQAVGAGSRFDQSSNGSPT
ncbi:MAG TPA: CHASE domain-containing protein [Burkholderiaceae bacterium]|nr:CHASE domain-containing protein [Burkholderiaceae bacterium]